MRLHWSQFDEFQAHTSVFEAAALFILVQISQDSIVIPRSWVDLHLPAILRANDLAKTPNWEQRCAYRDGLILLIQALIGLLVGPDHQGFNKFISCGREYPVRNLQQRNAELLCTILMNLLAVPVLCPPDIKVHWQAIINILGLPTVRLKHLEHPVGNGNMLRQKLVESHARYHGKNPLIIITLVDTPFHSFVGLQKAHNLNSESLESLRIRLSPTKKAQGETLSEAEQIVREQASASLVQRFWRKAALRSELGVSIK